MIFFIAEILQKSIKEEENNMDLFHFLQNSLQFLDFQEKGFANFHLLFLVKLSRFLGFYPQGEYNSENKYFDMSNGTFERMREDHPHYMNEFESDLLQQLVKSSFEDLHKFEIESVKRKNFLERLITYYSLHLSFTQDVVSHKILEESLY